MVEGTNVAQQKKEEERKLTAAEDARIDKGIEMQEKAQAQKMADEEKAIADREKAEAAEAEKEEKKHSIVVVDSATYVNKVDSREMNGVPRRLAGIRLMFEELGVDNYVERVTFKGTEAFVFKKRG